MSDHKNMNIIKSDNQRAIIHLSKIGGSFLARAVVLLARYDGSYASHVVGVQILTTEQAQDLKSKATALLSYNIYLIDATESSNGSNKNIYLPYSYFVLHNSVICIENISLNQVIESSYFSKIQLQEAFFSSQLTRGPNSK